MKLLTHNQCRRLGIAIVILNLLDALFTLVYIAAGVATEANPIMAFFLGVGEPAFILAKMFMVGVGVTFLARLAVTRRLAAFGLVVTAGCYTLLLGYHLSALSLLLR